MLLQEMRGRERIERESLREMVLLSLPKLIFGGVHLIVADFDVAVNSTFGVVVDNAAVIVVIVATVAGIVGGVVIVDESVVDNV